LHLCFVLGSSVSHFTLLNFLLAFRLLVRRLLGNCLFLISFLRRLFFNLGLNC